MGVGVFNNPVLDTDVYAIMGDLYGTTFPTLSDKHEKDIFYFNYVDFDSSSDSFGFGWRRD